MSTNGGLQPVWSRRGGELYFTTDEAMMAAPVQVGTTLAVGQPRKLFENRYDQKGASHTGYDVAGDGRFLMVKAAASEVAAPDNLRVVLNWLEELKEKVK